MRSIKSSLAQKRSARVQENNLLKPMIDTVTKNLGKEYVTGSKITADAGFHCAESVDYCFDQGFDAYIADGNFRKRDPPVC